MKLVLYHQLDYKNLTFAMVKHKQEEQDVALTLNFLCNSCLAAAFSGPGLLASMRALSSLSTALEILIKTDVCVMYTVA